MSMFYAAKKITYGTRDLQLIYGSASKSTMPISSVGRKAGDHSNLYMENFVKTSKTQGREKNTLNQAWANAI